MPRRKKTQGPQAQDSQENNSEMYVASFLDLLCFLNQAPRRLQTTTTPYVTEVGLSLFPEEPSIRDICGQIARRQGQLQPKLGQQEEATFRKVISLFGLEALFNQAPTSYLDFWKQAQPQAQNQSPLGRTKLPALVHPSFYLKEMMAVVGGEQRIGQRFERKPPQESVLFSEARFVDRLAEVLSSQKNNQHRGDVALVEFRGSFIEWGSRVFVVANHNYFDLWQKEGGQFPRPFQEHNQKYRGVTRPAGKLAQENILALGDSDSNSETDPDSEDQALRNLTKPRTTKPTKAEHLGMMHKQRFLGHSGKILCASLSKDQFYLVTGSADRTLRLWCLRLGVCLGTFKGHSKVVWDVEFCPSGLLVLSGGADGLMVLWKTDCSSPQRVFEHQADIYKVRFGHNPDYALCAGQQGLLWIYHLLRAQKLHCFSFGEPIFHFDLGSSGTYLAVVEAGGRATLHNIRQGRPLASFTFRSSVAGPNLPFHDLCFSQDEREVACVTSEHILRYSMDAMSGGEAVPSLVLQSRGRLSFRRCGFSSGGLLLVGGSAVI